MKTPLIFLLLFMTALPSLAGGGQSAKEAVRALGRERGSDLLGNVVLITGTKGIDQPPVWRIVTVEGSGIFTEHFVQQGKVISSGRVPFGASMRMSNQRISMKKWTRDSTAAFAVAEKSARNSKVGFDYADYVLRCAEFSDRPIWNLRLFTDKGLNTGEVTVGGDDGAILKKMMMVQVKQSAQSSTAQTTATTQSTAVSRTTAPPPTTAAPGTVAETVTVVKTGVTNVASKVRNWVSAKLTQPAPQQPYYERPAPQPRPQPQRGQTYYYKPRR